jgi:PKD domain/Fibronectin type III domain
VTVPRPFRVGGARALGTLGVVGLLLASGSLAVVAGSALAGSGAARTVAGLPTVAAGPSAGFALSDPGISPTAISLAWSPSTAGFFRNYTVFRSDVGATGPWEVAYVATSAAASTAVLTGLQPGASYWWYVAAYAGLFTATETDSSTLAAAQPTTAYLSETSSTSTSISLAWTNNATYGGGIAFGFYRLVEVDDGVASTAENLSAAGSTSATVTGLTAGASYTFYLETFDCVAGCGSTTKSFVFTESNARAAGTAAALAATLVASRSTTDAKLLTTFLCTASGGTPPYAYGWNFTNGSVSFLPGGSAYSWAFPAAASGGYRVTCSVQDHALDSYQVAVTELVNPAPTVRASASPTSASAGQSIAFVCAGTPGTSPLATAWLLGDGRTVNRSSAHANVTESYGGAGTYLAECVVTDTLGDRAVATVTLQVVAAPAYAWLTPAVVLLLSAVAGTVLAVGVALVGRRASRADRSSALSRWIPPAGPASSVHGAKICPKCGASNVPLRRSCSVCGTPLPRQPGP